MTTVSTTKFIIHALSLWVLFTQSTLDPTLEPTIEPTAFPTKSPGPIAIQSPFEIIWHESMDNHVNMSQWETFTAGSSSFEVNITENNDINCPISNENCWKLCSSYPKESSAIYRTASTKGYSNISFTYSMHSIVTKVRILSNIFKCYLLQIIPTLISPKLEIGNLWLLLTIYRMLLSKQFIWIKIHGVIKELQLVYL